MMNKASKSSKSHVMKMKALNGYSEERAKNRVPEKTKYCPCGKVALYLVQDKKPRCREHREITGAVPTSR